MQQLWYRQPAQTWVEALPIGNGRIGGMVYGGIQREVIALNEDSFWSGQPRSGQHADRRTALAQTRALLQQSQWQTAQHLVEQEMIEQWTESYLPVGNLVLTQSVANTSAYRRSLDLSTATAHTTFNDGAVVIQRTAYVSHPDQLLIIELTSSQPAALTCTLTLESLYTTQINHDAQSCWLIGRAPLHVEPSYVNTDTPFSGTHQGMQACISMHIGACDGQVTYDAGTVHITAASHATVYVSIATSFVAYDRASDADPEARARTWLHAGVAQTNHWQRHVADFQPLFQRMGLTLTPHRSDLPTDERLQRLRHGLPEPDATAVTFRVHEHQLPAVAIPDDDLGLVSLLLDMGRYLLISSSRPGTHAANLQGIWNDNPRPAWSSNYTININTQMNYWAALTGNLRECQAPLTQLITNLAVDGARVAARYGCRGWTSHHNTDIWAPANAVKGRAVWFMWPMSAIWLSYHLWEEVRFHDDLTFAAQTAWPLMIGAAEFALDWLQPQADGSLQSTPSTSPENLFVDPHGAEVALSIGSESDHAMIRAHFAACLDLAHRLGRTDDPTITHIAAALPRIPAPLIAADGTLKEWRHDLREYEPGHRHISHLYGLYPAHHIHPQHTPALASAARHSLVRRLAHGGGHTGWSAAWVAACLARLHDGDHALDILYRLLRDSTYPSLLGAHPPFQIDGSLGAPAAIIELLVQSHTDELHLLPALPTRWHEAGHAHGICARGGITVDLSWRAGQLQECRLTAQQDCTIRLRGPNALYVGTTSYDLQHGCTIDLVANRTVQLSSSAS